MNSSSLFFCVFLCNFNVIFSWHIEHPLVFHNTSQKAITIIIQTYTTARSYKPKSIKIPPTDVVSIPLDEVETKLLPNAFSRHIEVFTPDHRKSFFVQKLSATGTLGYTSLTISRLTEIEEEHAREEMLKPASGILFSVPTRYDDCKIQYKITHN